jgi:hypothetical protein
MSVPQGEPDATDEDREAIEERIEEDLQSYREEFVIVLIHEIYHTVTRIHVSGAPTTKTTTSSMVGLCYRCKSRMSDGKEERELFD